MAKFVVSQEEFIEVLGKPRNLRNKEILGLLYSTGMRSGELCTMRTKDVDLDNRQITIIDCARAIGLSRKDH